MTHKQVRLWNRLLEDLFEDMLRFIYPSPEEDLDMKRGFEFMVEQIEKGVDPEEDYSDDMVRTVVKAFGPGGEENWLFVYGKGVGGENLAEQMFLHISIVGIRCKRWIRPWVIFLDIGEGRDYSRWTDSAKPERIRYDVFRVSDQSDDVLAASDNPFALAVLAAKKGLLKDKVTEEELLEQKLYVAKVLLGKEAWLPAKVDKLMAFLKGYIVLEDKMEKVFEERISRYAISLPFFEK